jgi:hypothetical protein
MIVSELSYRKMAQMFWMKHFRLTWFHLSGVTNVGEFAPLISGRPHELHQTPLHDQNIGVWIAISRRRITGQSFFQKTINSERYCDILFPFVA